MPELVAKDERQYLSLAVELGEDKSRLQNVRQELAQKLPSAKLFDTTLFVNNLELALREIWVRHQRGEKPRDVYVRKLAT